LTGKPTKELRELYRIVELPLAEVTTICKAKIKVNADQILLRQNESAIKNAIQQVPFNIQSPTPITSSQLQIRIFGIVLSLVGKSCH
jgi:multisubunit Na+/H+ antiporter MnhE subunit